jgi:hypothetical protein
MSLSFSLSFPQTQTTGILNDRKKYEIATDEEFTPIKQDEKKGQLREVEKNCERRNVGMTNTIF